MNEIVGDSIMALFALMTIAAVASPWARGGLLAVIQVCRDELPGLDHRRCVNALPPDAHTGRRAGEIQPRERTSVVRQ